MDDPVLRLRHLGKVEGCSGHGIEDTGQTVVEHLLPAASTDHIEAIQVVDRRTRHSVDNTLAVWILRSV